MIWPCVLWAAAVALLLPGQPPDFSGTWQLDRTRSRVPAETSTLWMRVDQADAVIQVNLRAFHQAGDEENQFFTYFIGGTDNHNTMHGAPMTSRATWNGQDLTFHSDASFGQDHLHLDDRWTLSGDRATLTFQQTSQFGHDPIREASYVFARRDPADWPAETATPRAEEVFGNIRILAGRPASEVSPLMATFTRALGVSCSYCHVPGSWDVGDRPPFSIAREMARMTSTFGGGPLADRGGLTCWTCHRGQAHPARFPSAELQADLGRWPAALTSAPDSLKLTMTVYARSLGVGCDFCHTADNWKSQDKAPMRAMPIMLALFREMPNLSPVAANRAQCWMCHQGRLSPERTPGR